MEKEWGQSLQDVRASAFKCPEKNIQRKKTVDHEYKYMPIAYILYANGGSFLHVLFSVQADRHAIGNRSKQSI